MEPPTTVRSKRWTREEYDRLIEGGYFHPEARLQLIEGEIVEMTPQSPPHATSIQRLARALESTFARAHHVRQQLPIALSDDSEPEPDVAVVSGGIEDYARAHPASPVLIAEIADSTLGFDRLRKQPMYARAGVPEYWILNLVDAVLEVYREPSWAGYSVQLRLGRDDIVSPVGAPNAVVRVAELLPTTPSAG